MRMFFTLLGAALLSGCVVYVQNEVKHYPSKSQERFPRGELVFACTTVAGIYDYLDNGIVSRHCGMVSMTAAHYRSTYDAYDGVRYRIVEFRHGFTLYFTFDRQARHRHW